MRPKTPDTIPHTHLFLFLSFSSETQTDTEFNLEKSNLIHMGRLKVLEEYAQKEKDLQAEQRVAKSSSVAQARVRKMEDRDKLLEQLKQEALARLAQVCKSPEYPAILKKLIVQGLIKIEEPVVEIACRPEDKVRARPYFANIFPTTLVIETALITHSPSPHPPSPF